MRPLAFLGGLSLLLGSIGARASAQAPLFGDLHTMIPWDADPSSAVALGDVDGDGDLDVVVGNKGTPDRLYRNDGSGVLTPASGALPAIVNNTRALGLGDLDGDGDLDLLIGNDGIQDRLYLNNGAGAFSDATGQFPSFPGPDATRGIALGDVD
ncbi:MAG TPA: FG-GAP-like repeat-containing protein, partial [Planctomycetota bacterium]|nr:FG-GAP-like repeat-containing protein [Planctomycetota bacterium]